MRTATQPFALPPWRQRQDGEPRRVGVEFEYGGLRPEQSLAAIVSALGGHQERITQVQYKVRDTVVGDLELELDFRWLQKAASDQQARQDLPTWALEVGQWTTEVLERMVSQVVPWEVVTGPIPMPQLHRLEGLVQSLREAGALGTRHAPHFAFGLHLNPELPDLEGATLCAYMKAYLCLKDWLRARSRLDLSRRLTPFIGDFDPDYVARVVDPDYQPDRAQLIDDYLAANPTRNRSLDMLPAFSEADPERVRAQVDDPLIKARPALHYRLPNCEIDDPGWKLATIWEQWLQVERLAADPERLAAMGEAYRSWLQQFHLPFDEAWIRESERWLD